MEESQLRIFVKMIELFTTCRFDIQWFLSISATVGKVRTAHPASLKLTSKKFGTKNGKWSVHAGFLGKAASCETTGIA